METGLNWVRIIGLKFNINYMCDRVQRINALTYIVVCL